MDSRPLVTEEVEAGSDLVSRFSRYVPVKVAFWLKPSDGSGWRLYLASDQLTDENIEDGYKEVLRLMGEMNTQYIEKPQVRLIGADKPLARAAIDLFRRYPPTTLPIRYDGPALGGIGIEEAYLYPPPPANAPVDNVTP